MIYVLIVLIFFKRILNFGMNRGGLLVKPFFLLWNNLDFIIKAWCSLIFQEMFCLKARSDLAQRKAEKCLRINVIFSVFSALFRKKKKVWKKITFYFLLAESKKYKILAANQIKEFDAFHFSAFRLAKNVSSERALRHKIMVHNIFWIK